MSDDELYFRVGARFWDDANDLGWDATTQRVALYILTNKHRWTEGLYRLPASYVTGDLKITGSGLKKALAKLERDGFIERDGEWLLILKALKWQAPRAESNVKHAVAKVKVANTPLLARLVELAADLCPPFASALVAAKPELREMQS